MATKTGWKKASNDDPYVYGCISYTVSRDNNNKVTFNFNQGYHLTATKGYWNWPWRVSFECEGKTYKNKTVKPTTSGVIQNKDYWLSSQAGAFTGSVTVKGTASSITLYSTFSDTAKHTGPKLKYSIPIPTAGTPSFSVAANSVTSNSASVVVSGMKAGNYATLSKVTLTYNGKTLTGSTGSSYTFNLTGLAEGSKVDYKVTVTNSAGQSASKSGSFTTGSKIETTATTEVVVDPVTQVEEVIIVDSPIPNKVIFPDGTIKEFSTRIILPSGGIKKLDRVVQI